MNVLVCRGWKTACVHISQINDTKERVCQKRNKTFQLINSLLILNLGCQNFEKEIVLTLLLVSNSILSCCHWVNGFHISYFIKHCIISLPAENCCVHSSTARHNCQLPTKIFVTCISLYFPSVKEAHFLFIKYKLSSVLKPIKKWTLLEVF